MKNFDSIKTACSSCGYPAHVGHAKTCEKAAAPEKTERAPDLAQEKNRRKKEIQMQVVREWGEKQDPPLVEGEDFIFITDIRSVTEEGDNIAPHEVYNLYFGYKKEHFKKIQEFFKTQYIDDMNEFRDKEPETFSPWAKRETTFNYSHSGRYMVEQAAGGVPIDSIPVESMEAIATAETHHKKFKEFFKEKTGFEMPSTEELDQVLIKMRESLPWYQKALELVQEKRNKIDQMPPEEQDKIDWDKLPNIYNLQYINIILENAANPEKWTDGAYFQEIPEKIEASMIEQVRHYSDFTYNADDWFDLDLVDSFVGDELEQAGLPRLPEEEGRIDRVFALVGRMRGDKKMQEFDRARIEQVCKDFSEELYG